MKNKATATLSFVICMLVALTLIWPLSGCTQPTAAPKTAELPKIISISCFEMGSSGYLESAGMRAAVEQFTPMSMKLEPYDSDLTRNAPLRSGKTEFINQTSVTAYWVTRGLEQFKDWGPNPMRRVWKGKSFTGGNFARADSGITKIADLRGKRIPQSPVSLGWSLNNEAGIAFGGLTLKDVQVVTVSSISAGLKGVLEGTLDASQGTPWHSAPQELAASRHGIRWFDMLPTDKEGWDRVRKVTPWAYPVKTDAAGLKKGETVWMLGYENAVWAYSTVPSDVVYAFVKALKDGYDIMKKMHPDLANWSWDWAVSLEGVVDIPYHDGTVKLFKDMGVWTAEHEAFQQKQLSAEKERMQKAKK